MAEQPDVPPPTTHPMPTPGGHSAPGPVPAADPEDGGPDPDVTADEVTQAHLPPQRLPLEELLARPMFYFALFFLAVLGGLIHRHKLPDPEEFSSPEEAVAVVLGENAEAFDIFTTELYVQLWIVGCLWPIFWIEGLVRFGQARRAAGWYRPLRDFLAVALIPPWRMGLRSQGPGRQIWLPRLGWRTVDRDLNRDLERAFGLPMICIALLVLPLLVTEFFFAKQVRQYPWLQFWLEAGNALVWFAFTLEFIIMLAVAKHRFRYVLTHWIDLAIILLPLVHFLPLFRMLRLGRVLRLEQLSRLGRLYRMQGVALRAWRAFLLLQLIQRILGTSLEKQLERLRELEQAKLEELEELREEIAQLELRLTAEAAGKKEKVTSDREGESSRQPPG